MLEKTKGIVLKTFKYSETSLIAKVFTGRFGQLSFIVPGIRSSKSGKGNLLQPGQILDIDCYFRENKNFQRFKEFKVSFIPQHIHRDVRKFSMLTFIIELTSHLVNEKEENGQLFEHIHNAIIEIDQNELPGIYPIQQLLDISRIMGFHPSDNFTMVNKYFNLQEGSYQSYYEPGDLILDDGPSLLIHRLLKGETALPNTDRRLLLDTLIDYFRLHVPGFKPLRSVDVLHEILS